MAAVGMVVGALLLLVMIAVSLAAGEISLSYQTVVQVIASHLGLPVWSDAVAVSALQDSVVWHYRLPRVMAAALGGSSLALCGVVLQALLRNPLAEPYVLGLSAGASAGAVAVTVAGVAWGWALSAGAFAGAVAAFCVVMLLAAHREGSASQTLLAGIASSQLFNAIAACLMASSASAEQIRGLLFWLLGDLSAVRLSDVPWLAASAVMGLVVCLAVARPLDVLSLGERSAFALGVPVARLRYLLLALTALMTALVVSRIGAIGFVGIVVPHLVRRWVGVRHRRRIPAAMLLGAVFVVVADLLSRTLMASHSLPIGVVTAIVGAPVFALLLRQRSSARDA